MGGQHVVGFLSESGRRQRRINGVRIVPLVHAQ
jgi:hypothetical protein